MNRIEPDGIQSASMWGTERQHYFTRSTVLRAIDEEIARWDKVNAPDDNNEQWALERLRARFQPERIER